MMQIFRFINAFTEIKVQQWKTRYQNCQGQISWLNCKIEKCTWESLIHLQASRFQYQLPFLESEKQEMKISVIFNEILSRKVMDRLGGWRCGQVSKYARDPKMIEGGGLS